MQTSINKTTNTTQTKTRFQSAAKILSVGDIGTYPSGKKFRRVSAVLTNKSGSRQQSFTMAGKAYEDLSKSMRPGRNLMLAFVSTKRDGRSYLDVVGYPTARTATPTAATA